VSGFVVLFAALDRLAVFPLLCTTLGGILRDAFLGDDCSSKASKTTVVFFRLLASVPQLIGAVYIDDLRILAKYGSIFTLLSFWAGPTWLYLVSGHRMQEEGLPKGTSYSSRIVSREHVAHGVLLLAFLAIAGIILDAVFVD